MDKILTTRCIIIFTVREIKKYKTRLVNVSFQEASLSLSLSAALFSSRLLFSVSQRVVVRGNIDFGQWREFSVSVS